MKKQKNKKTKKIFFLITLFIFFFSTFSFAEENLINFLQSKIDIVIKTYNKKTEKGKKKKEIEKKIKEIFDFKTISMLAVARKWKKFNKSEKDEFIKHFSKLLIDRYYEKFNNNDGKIDVKITYLSQRIIKKKRAIIKTQIPIKDKDGEFTPIDYKLVKKNGVWRVYDIYVEGISLIKNYREQFSEILMRNPPSYLIKKVKNMVTK